MSTLIIYNAKLNMSVEEAIPNAINDVKMIAVDSLMVIYSVETLEHLLRRRNRGMPKV